MPIGKLVSLPAQGYKWGQVRDEHGNNWNVTDKNLPKGKSVGEDVAYRLDFSNPSKSPQLMASEDD